MIDPTLTHPAQEPVDIPEAARNAGTAAAFGDREPGSLDPVGELNAGTVLAGNYRLVERTGTGGMAASGWPTSLNR